MIGEEVSRDSEIWRDVIVAAMGLNGLQDAREEEEEEDFVVSNRKTLGRNF